MIASDMLQCLSSTLSQDSNTRISAELRLSELLKNPESGLGLSQITLAHDIDMSLRQMSCCYFVLDN
jgi:importin-9